MSERQLFADSIRDTLYDVFNLETNTIIGPEITARRMPPTMHAVLDIAQAYKDFLAEKGAESDTLPATVTTSPKTFTCLAKAAKALLKSDAERRLRSRIPVANAPSS